MTTTLRFSAEDELAKALEVEAARSGITTDDLLARAVKDMLYRLVGNFPRCLADHPNEIGSEGLERSALISKSGG